MLAVLVALGSVAFLLSVAGTLYGFWKLYERFTKKRVGYSYSPWLAHYEPPDVEYVKALEASQRPRIAAKTQEHGRERCIDYTLREGR